MRGISVEVAVLVVVQEVLALVSELAYRGRVLRVEVGGASLEEVFVVLSRAPAVPTGTAG